MTLQKPEYEAGMKVVYDSQSRRVIVNFRGRVHVLPDTYDNERDAVSAGERHCTHLGWNREDGAGHRNRVHSPWR